MFSGKVAIILGVNFININGFGTSEYPWEIYLHAGNNPDWFRPHRGG